MCCVAKRNKNPNTLPLRMQGFCLYKKLEERQVFNSAGSLTH